MNKYKVIWFNSNGDKCENTVEATNPTQALKVLAKQVGMKETEMRQSYFDILLVK